MPPLHDGRVALFPLTSSLICDYILGRGGGKFDMLQVIKIAFICYGYVLAHHNKVLFREDIEAWVYGPVIPSIHDMLKKYGNMKIKLLQYSQTEIGGTGFESEMDYIMKRIEPGVRKTLDIVIDEYGNLSGYELVRLTHRKGSPWSKSYKEGAVHTIISNDEIRKYYASIGRG